MPTLPSRVYSGKAGNPRGSLPKSSAAKLGFLLQVVGHCGNFSLVSLSGLTTLLYLGWHGLASRKHSRESSPRNTTQA